MQQKDIRLEVRARNNLILSKMEAKGIASTAELQRRLSAHGIQTTQSTLGDFINMKLSGRNPKTGEWRPVAFSLAVFFECTPGELFSEVQQRKSLTKNRVVAEMTFAEVQRLTSRMETPEMICEQHELERAVARELATLTPREQSILRMRFGIGDEEEMTLVEVAEALGGLSSTRVQQLEAKALWKLKRPGRRKRLEPFLGPRRSL